MKKKAVSEVIRKFLNPRKSTVKEVKYFHPDGKPIPNSLHIHKGYYFEQCVKNSNSFELNEKIHDKQYGLRDYRGGVIVFTTDVNADKLRDDEIKQFLETFTQRLKKDEKPHTVRHKSNSEDFIGTHSLGHFFKGKYVGENGEIFNNESLALKIKGLSSKELLRLGEKLANDLVHHAVIIKDLNTNKIYIAESSSF